MISFIAEYWLGFLFTGIVGLLAFLGKKFVFIGKKGLQSMVEDQVIEHDNKIIKTIEEKFKIIDERQADQILKLENKTNLLTEAIFAIEYDKLNYLFHRILDREYLLGEEVAIVENVYNSYRSLGGNGEIQRLYAEVQKLPIKTKKGEDE